MHACSTAVVVAIGVKVVISETHTGLINAIQGINKFSCWQRCQAHFAIDLPKT